MDQGRQLTWQLTVIMCTAIITFGGGTFVLLAMGRTVPGEIWPILGGIGTAILGIGGFFNMRQMHAASLWHLAQANVPADHTAVIPTHGTTTITTGTEGNSQ